MLAGLSVEPQAGLGGDAVKARRERYGPNEIKETGRRGPLRIFVSQFADFMIFVLIVAAIVSGIVGEAQDTIAIVVIVLLNAVIGAVQEYRAERAVAALRAMAAPEAQVRRDGMIRSIPAKHLVPGDIVLLEAGQIVPADLRLLEVVQLKLDEAALTGESHAVEKHTGALPEAACLSAIVATWRTRARWSPADGVQVLLWRPAWTRKSGRIAALLHENEMPRTPLQQRLTVFGRRLGIAVLGVCALIFVFGLLRGEPVALMFLTAVTLAVAAIPEALPAVITVSLAIGAHKMSARHALIRALPAVETLGSVTYICSDKTGTLTQNRMKVDALLVNAQRRPELPGADTAALPWRLLGQALALNNDAQQKPEQGIAGDPTEVALYSAARMPVSTRPGSSRTCRVSPSCPLTRSASA